MNWWRSRVGEDGSLKAAWWWIITDEGHGSFSADGGLVPWDVERLLPRHIEWHGMFSDGMFWEGDVSWGDVLRVGHFVMRRFACASVNGLTKPYLKHVVFLYYMYWIGMSVHTIHTLYMYVYPVSLIQKVCVRLYIWLGRVWGPDWPQISTAHSDRFVLILYT